MEIRENLERLKKEIPGHVTLVAVSKTHPAETVMEAYNAGQRIFGENKAQEMIAKQSLLPGDIQWHFIGHLQRNKVKFIAPFVGMIESVDSLRLLKEINKEAGKAGRIIPVLLQFHIASEETKFGLDMDEARQLLNAPEYREMKHINLRGVMGMASLTDDETLIRKEFSYLRSIFEELRKDYFSSNPEFSQISMGMSGDYAIAIEEGSTMVRIGTGIFGEREYGQL